MTCNVTKDAAEYLAKTIPQTFLNIKLMLRTANKMKSRMMSLK
jgi:hypothetical protein